ncbi:Cytochrome P450 [Macrophomina phaseolina MS6]|uniref:Cytochrome P450 n=1 Tax=Macrophomina phaseolina (strain MS6) TaxID=1126212 RepID=K2SB55_MACPH|nr:Cytochrome P450 [Macrophomina phaseolina MS6]
MASFFIPVYNSLGNTMFAIVGIAIFYAAWRIWRFTVQPALHPERAKELPYLIPFVGHAFSFFADGNGTISRGRRYFQNNREPFALTVFGATIYVVLTAADVATVFRRTDALTFDSYITDIMAQIGLTQGAIDAMWRYRPASSGDRKGAMVPNPGKKPLVHLSEAIFKYQLHPGKQLDVLQDALLDRIHEVMTWDAMTLSSTAVLGHGVGRADKRRASLLHWVRFVLLEGATRAFFGNALLDKVDPGILEDFADFDDQSWKLVYRLPPPWSVSMKRSLKRVKASFTRYFEMPVEERLDACWMVRAMESEMAAAGIQPPDIAANLFLIYWVSVCIPLPARALGPADTT